MLYLLCICVLVSRILVAIWTLIHVDQPSLLQLSHLLWFWLDFHNADCSKLYHETIQNPENNCSPQVTN